LNSIKTLVDPTGTILGFGIYFSLLVLFSYTISFKWKFSLKELLLLLLCAFLPAFTGFFRGLFSLKIDFDFARSTFNNYINFFFYFLPLCLLRKKELIKILWLASFSLVLIYGIAWLSLIPSFEILSGFSKYLHEQNYTVMYGPGDFLFSFTMFYKTAPVLLVYLGYLLFENNKKLYPLIMIVVLLLLASGTQANQLSVLFILFFKLISLLFYQVSNKSLIGIYFILSILILLIVAPFIITIDDGGNGVKMGHFIGYLDTWEEKPFNLLWGAGFGVSFYTTGRMREVLLTELSWLEYLRRHGVIISFLFFCAIVYPIIVLARYQEARGVWIGYLAYFFVAGTNPLLTSSTGFFVIGFTLAYSLKIRFDTNFHIFSLENKK
jgi:hypothetical protein